MNKYKCALGVWGSVGFGDYRKRKEACVGWLAGWLWAEERVGAVPEIQGAHPPGWSC